MLNSKIVFLNHGSFGACAKPVYNNLLYWQKKLEAEPVKFFEDTIFKALRNSRMALSDYINCSENDLVYFPNPTTAINAVARSLKLKSNDEVLSTNHIYGALDRSWRYICAKKNVKFVKARIPFPITSKKEFMNIFMKYVTDRTRVIFISHITSMTAMIFPVEEIIKFAKKNNILTIIDGAHVPGHISLNIKKLDPDIYTGACHKWMCTPKGVSFLYVKKNLQNTVHPLIISWGWESDNPSKYQFLDWHEWQGTRDMSAFLTVPTAIEFLSDNNWNNVALKCKKQVVELRRKILELLNIPPPCPENWLAQMASIPIEINDPTKFKNILLDKYHIQIPVFTWENKNYMRFSIQGYNSQNDFNQLLLAITDLLT